MKLSHGQYVVGRCLGVKDNQRQMPDGNMIREVFVGIAFPVNNGYDGQENITDVKMSKAAIDSGEYQQFTKVIQKNVAVPINAMSRAYNGKAYTTNYFDNRRGVVVLDNPQ